MWRLIKKLSLVCLVALTHYVALTCISICAAGLIVAIFALVFLAPVFITLDETGIRFQIACIICS